jgi:hypothetical protein
VPEFNRSAEDIGNIVALEHVNTCVPDQQLALTFYVTGLGLTRDPFMRTGTQNMWINIGRSQFHLPTNAPQILRGRTGLVMRGRDKLLDRLQGVGNALDDTHFTFAEHDDYVDVTCPWGNRIRCHSPGAAFGQMRLGMPYVELDVPVGSAVGIARFYDHVMATTASVSEGTGGAVARVSVGDGQTLVFRETNAGSAAFDGHHIAVYLADFSGPHRRLLERRLISQESDQHQYRFVDIVDPDDGRLLFQLEHEVRSMRHPMYARHLVNRNPAITDDTYVAGQEEPASGTLAAD